MTILKSLVVPILFITCMLSSFAQQKKIELNGLIVDETNNAIPYAAVGIPSKYVGTASTEDGTFNLLLSESHLSDSLEVSSIGYVTFKIKVQDFLDQKDKTIIIKEDIVSLNEVNILNPSDYVKLALKNRRKTTITKPHQLNILYRRFSEENGKARFLVEHYMNVLDFGPNSGEFGGEEIIAGRRSADYRFLKKKLNFHPIDVIPKKCPLRNGMRLNDFKWSRKGDTSYDGEDVIIIEGRSHEKNWVWHKFYIGMETYGVYKVESSDLNALYIYKKDNEGKLHLSYHTRTRNGKMALNETQKKLLNVTSNTVKEAYKHEVYVLGVERNKRIVNSGNYTTYKIDIGDIEVDYNPVLWKNLSLPPESAFYKKSAKQLESIFNVPLETQFKVVN